MNALLAAARLVVLAAAAASACGAEESDLDFSAREGESCEDCESCKDIVKSCVCRTCTEYAFDESNGKLLVCTANGKWEVEEDCPGGGSVSCSERGYSLQCFDEDGRPIDP